MKKYASILFVIIILLFLWGCAYNHTLQQSYGIADAELYHSKSIQKLMEATKDNDKDVRKTAAQCLGKFSEPDAVKTLEIIARSDNDADVRKEAELGLINLKTRLSSNPSEQLVIGRSAIDLTFIPLFHPYIGFYYDVITYRTLPIQINLKNLSNQSLIVDIPSCKLVDPSGKAIGPLESNEVLSRFHWSYPTPLLLTIPLLIPFTIPAFIKISKKNEMINKFVYWGNMDGKVLRKNESLEGYLFFDVSNYLAFFHADSVDKWKLEIGIKEKDSKQIFVVEKIFPKPAIVKNEGVSQ
jgi:hypothetical protein